MFLDSPLIIPLADGPDPLQARHRVSGLPSLALLEGAADHHDLGRWSYLTADPIERIEVRSSEWPQIKRRLRATMTSPGAGDGTAPAPFMGGWIGWLGYELGAAFDVQPVAPRDPFSDIDGELFLYDWVVAWDHLNEASFLISTGLGCDGTRSRIRGERRAAEILELLTQPYPEEIGEADAAPRSVENRSFSRKEYEAAVGEIIHKIRAGDIFQANLSQRFVVATNDDAASIYGRLRSHSPASHAALLSFGDRSVISASPESFLRYGSATRRIESRPIKGTRPRGPTEEDDQRLSDELRSSVKDRAENLMIVDLVRNDLHRVANPASVAVPELCRLDSHATVHHLVSHVTAELSRDLDAFDLLEATFPAGSITGAPKLRAMAILAELEPVARGAYCGAIGWIGLDGSLGFSVAIRTMMIRDGAATVHAGGGITLLSDPADEYEECLTKARAPLRALGVSL